MNVTAAIAEHARAAPDRLALIVEDDALTYAQLEEVVSRLAASLHQEPLGGIALHLPNGLPLALLSLAAARAGREAQILDPDWPAEMTQRVLASLRPARVFTSTPSVAGDQVVLIDRSASLQTLSASLAPPCHGAVPKTDPSTAFYVGFTSGSTGEPKGYRRSHRSWLESFTGDAIEFGLGPTDIVAAPGTLTHSLFLYAFMNGLHAGATVILSRRFKPTQVLHLITQYGATVLYGVPTQLTLVIEAAEEGQQEPLSSLRWILSSGAKWFSEALPRLKAFAPNARFAEFYGASELSFVTVAKDSEPVPVTSVGRAFPGVTITIRDEAGCVLPVSQPGRVFVESPLVFMNYAYGGTGGCWRAGSAVSVGDVGFLDAGGFLHLVGRANRMIVSSGKNVYPEEIERVFEQHPGIAAVAVLSMPDAQRGERIVAMLALRDQSVSRSALIAYGRRALPLFKVPRVYGVVSDWPLTRSGKTDHEALREAWPQGRYKALR
ncbi:AMP-binding protein [Microvirga tunisiensis]|uniref:AMP-binding protein n=1 Tax=Microvirga tunisiensis TaxID=2108360 RepID=A0A5N7MJB3_9HYPH|nr:AMP-binding protein [Microvirga tunisiensis]MPR08982.1 AMP-binding protein [Microvirga tunisiensis]MPR27182.1 AMP-binding protein [Microvirga tunisiensis]